jgi:hypothetical protein
MLKVHLLGLQTSNNHMLLNQTAPPSLPKCISTHRMNLQTYNYLPVRPMFSYQKTTLISLGCATSITCKINSCPSHLLVNSILRLSMTWRIVSLVLSMRRQLSELHLSCVPLPLETVRYTVTRTVLSTIANSAVGMRTGGGFAGTRIAHAIAMTWRGNSPARIVW